MSRKARTTMKQEPLPQIEPEAEREVRSKRINLLWPPSLKEAAEQAAAQRRMSLNELTIRAMRLVVQQQGEAA